MDRTSDQRHDLERQEGFALIAVIWIGILLALMAAAFSSSVRSRIRSTAMHADTLRAEALADAGVRMALLELLNRDRTNRAPPRFSGDGTPVACAIGSEATLVIQVEDEEGKVNLNTANEELLLALFAGLGAPRDKARTYAETVLDFHNAGQGSERGAFKRDGDIMFSGNAPRPRAAEFMSTDALDQIRGIPADLRDKAKPYLTVFSSSDGIDEAAASKVLKDILVRGSNGIVTAAADGAAADSTIEISSRLPQGFLSRSAHRIYGIRAEAALPSGARYVSEAVVGLPAGEAAIPVFQHWRRASSRLTGEQRIPAAQNLHPC